MEHLQQVNHYIEENFKVNKIKVGARIRQIRNKMGLNLEQFGVLLDASRGTVSNWESGVNLPHKDRIQKIALFGGLSMNMLILGHEIAPIPKQIVKRAMGLDLKDYISVNQEIYYDGKQLTEEQREQLLNAIQQIVK